LSTSALSFTDAVGTNLTVTNLTYSNVNVINVNVSTISFQTGFGSTITLSTVTLGANTLYDSNQQGIESSFCGVSRLYTYPLSSFTNSLTIADSYSSTNFTFQKQYLHAASTSITAARFETFGERIALGWIPNVSSQSFVPILQQIQLIEQSTLYNQSTTTTNVVLQNAAFLDDICAANGLTIRTSNLTIDSNTITQSNTRSHVIGAADCGNGFVYTSSASSLTNYFNIADSYTGTQFAIQKNSKYWISTGLHCTKYESRSEQVQIGWVPNLSTQGVTEDNQFVPILQQIQILETATDCTDSSIGAYKLVNVAKLDQICATNGLVVNAPNVSISSMTISSINGQIPGTGSGGNLSTFTSLYWDNAVGNTAYISSLNISSINGQSIFNQGGGVSTMYSTFSTIYWSSAFALNTNTTYANVSTMLISTIMGNDLPILTFDRVHRRMGVNLGATQQPRAALDVNGIVYANNFVTSSDRRLKTNITALEQPNDIPMSYRFQYIETGEWDIGCMADEIEQIAPECVHTAANGYKTVAYSKLVPVCLTLIRDLTRRIEVLERR